MKHIILLLLISFNIHGIRHKISHRFLDLIKYKQHKKEREQVLSDYMKTNGIGVDQ